MTEQPSITYDVSGSSFSFSYYIPITSIPTCLLTFYHTKFYSRSYFSALEPVNEIIKDADFKFPFTNYQRRMEEGKTIMTIVASLPKKFEEYRKAMEAAYASGRFAILSELFLILFSRIVFARYYASVIQQNTMIWVSPLDRMGR